MRSDVSAFDVIGHTFWLGAEPDIANPRMRRIAECVGDIRPAIVRAAAAYGDRRIVWALTAIIVDMAIEAGDAEMVAAIFRTNARLLERETGVDLLGIDP
ncbi:hypothetical protein H0I76_03680 [Limibaculum sp. M0105]|uniref:Uncharacterized protein n=1 Tax=Thermohalobaculum xanthum TaxID=2753746 RepID=A0A8J7M5W1_9RHOB|nr:hypothetical protein [Thermohalobaculum xanthum]MBK0398280.1 hypothetical protein [Thermohalobaculum xanthum]